MEKKTSKKYSSIWSFSRFRNTFRSLISSVYRYGSASRIAIKSTKGFTLLELIIDITILAVLASMLLVLVDPGKQISKAKDGQRQRDFDQIRIALDTYYNDFNCYPQTLLFGNEWKVDATIYMKEVPQDPNCGSGQLCYAYVVDTTSACPQWHVLFGQFRVAPLPTTPACLLQSDCLPSNYLSNGYNFCDYGGNIDCASIQATMLPDPEEVVTSEGGPTGDPDTSPTPMNGTPVPSPSPTFAIPQDGIFYCGCGNNHVTVCNVTFTIPQGIPYYGNSTCNNQCGQSC